MKKTTLLSIVVLLVTLVSAPAATRLVPDEYGTIQAAIDASIDGDVVIIAPATYTGTGNRDIDFGGKAITVQSTDPQDPAVVAATVIDCQGTETNPHRGFYFHNSEGPDSVLAGLTITNGYGPGEMLLDVFGTISIRSAGGAIFCYQSSPTIMRCKIKGNIAKDIGGGMCNYECSPSVLDCTFSENSAHSGAGINNWYSSPKMTNCILHDNSAYGSGGGVVIHGRHEATPTITKCIFTANSSLYNGGAVFNRAETNLTVNDCTFIGNSASRDGGGIYNYASSPTVTNCIFSKNSAGEKGGGIKNIGDLRKVASSPTLTNCTFSGNSAGFDGGGMYNQAGSYNRRVCDPTVTNCIFWDNRDRRGVTQSSQIYVPDDGTPTINYSCIQGWDGSLEGTANIDEDPAFVYPATGNYHLLPGSPCINAGDPNYIYVPEEFDIDGDPRVMDGRIDMGVDEFILTPEPIIGISPTEFEIYADVGGANPENQILTIHNMGGGGTLYWMVAEDCPWLDVYPESGESTGEIDEVTLSVNISGMSSGLYICELTITADGIVNSPQTVRIILHILDNDGLLHVPLEYGTIQVAIDTAVDGQAVILAPRTYTGYGNRDLDFGGKAITVRNTNPNDPVVVAATVIDCQGSEANPHRGFRFHCGEGPDSIIAGLTITNGFGQHEHVGYAYASAGGAIFCVLSNPTISRCRIQGNEAGHMGGGIHNELSNATITNCTLSGNLATYGAGVYNINSCPTVTGCTFSGNSAQGSVSLGAGMGNSSSSPTITNCTFIGNSSDSQAGGVYNGDRCAPTISNCIFSGNSAEYGGAMYNGWYSTTKVSNCLFSGNWARDNGGAMLNSRGSLPTITNCTFTGNSAVGSGGSILNYSSSSILTNCVLWGNLPNEIDGIATVSYSNIHGGWPGEGNLDTDPLLAPDGYHLQTYSPCINTGDLNFVPVPGETDIDDEPRVMGGRVDMGADEFTSTLTPILRIWPTEFLFSSYKDGPNPQARILSISNIGSGTLIWEIDEDCPWLHVHPTNGESIGEINEVTLSVDVSGMEPGVYDCQLVIAADGALNSPQIAIVNLNLGGADLYVPSEYDTIQAAIDAAIDWDIVVVADGIYTGPGNCDIDFMGKPITVRSENGPDGCIIDCNGTEDNPHRGFYFYSGEDTNSVLSGFTITNGYASRGGGIYCEKSSPTITNCTFRDNIAQYYYGYYPPPLPPSPYWWGNGGAVCCIRSNPMLIDCTFSSNCAENSGGGMYNMYSSPMLTNCTLNGNSADADGGGMNNYESNPVLTNCTLTGNRAWYGGGIYYQFLSYPPPPPPPPGPFADKIVDGTAAENADTDTNYYSGVHNIIITNCILWSNEAPDGPQIYLASDSYASVNYSDVQGGWPGTGNIDADPLFVEPGYWDANGLWIEGDYHLLPGSPCIDAGDPDYVAGPNETDLDGNPRIIGGRIDMGAYEFFNTRPVADAGPEKVVECACNTNEGTKVTLDGTGSYDSDGDLLTYTWTGPFIESPAYGATPTVTLDGGCPGGYVITLVVNDGTEDSEPNDVMITVVDTTPPEFALSVNPTMLWPPSHQMVKITPTWTVSDNCDAMPGVSLVSISINESNSKGNGRTDDVKIGDDGSIYLRAERSGAGKDRVYTITYRAVDDCGNATVRSATVTVPHDRR